VFRRTPHQEVSKIAELHRFSYAICYLAAELGHVRNHGVSQSKPTEFVAELKGLHNRSLTGWLFAISVVVTLFIRLGNA